MRVSTRLTEIHLRIRQWWGKPGNDEHRQSQVDTATIGSLLPSSGSQTPNAENPSSTCATDETRKTVDYPEADIFALLTAQGGIIRQADIVAQTDWSKSTISRYLTKLEADGKVKRITLSRSKLVLLPGRDLADFTELSHDLR